MAKFEITTAKGKYVIEAPDDATEDQVLAFAQAKLGEVEPDAGYRAAATPALRESLNREPAVSDVQVTRPGTPWTDGDDLLSSTGNALAGTAEGIVALPEMVVDGLDAMSSAIQYGVGKTIEGGLDLVGLDGAADWVGRANDRVVPDMQARAGGMSRAIQALAPRPTEIGPSLGRAAVSGISGAGSGVGIGRQLSKAADPALRSLGALLGTMPGQQIAAGGVASMAAEGAKQAGAPVPVQIAAGVAGGGLTPSAARATAGVVDGAVDRLTDSGVMDEAAGFIRANMARPEQANVNAMSAAGPTASGAQPTLAEVTRDPGLAAMQRGVGNLSTTAGARITDRTNANAHARATAIERTLGPGNPDDITQAARGRERALVNDAAVSREAVGPAVAPDVAGAQARELIGQGHRSAKARTREAYDAPALRDDPPVQLRPQDRADLELPTYTQEPDLGPFKDSAVKGARGALPSKPRSLLQFVRKGGGIAADGMGADDLRSGGLDARNAPGLINRNGTPLDTLRESAVEAGFIDERTTLSEFATMLEDEVRGLGRVVERSNLSAQADYDDALANRDFWRRQFDERDLDPLKMTDAQWRTFHDELQPAQTDQAVTLDDLTRERAPGALVGPFQQTLLSLRDRFFGDGGAEAPAFIRSFFSDVLDADTVGLRTLEGWERRANDLAARAPDRTTGAFMQAVGRSIGARAAIEAGPERRAALDTARATRREQGDVFETGPVGRTTARGDYGRPALPDSEVGRVAVPRGRGGGEAADQLQRATGQGAEGIARTELRRALDAAGDDPRAISRAARDYGEVLSRFPALDRDVRAARQNAALTARFRSTELGSFLRDNADPGEAVAKLLRTQDGGRAFRSLVSGPGMNPGALAGTRRAVAGFIANGARTSGVDDNLQAVPSTRKLIDGIETALERSRGTSLLAPSQRATLNAVRRELRADQFRLSANRTSGSDTARNAGLAFRALEGALRLAPAGARNVIEFIFEKSARTEDILSTVAQAVEDPKFAAMLLARPTPDRVRRVVEGVRAYNQAALIGSSTTAE